MRICHVITRLIVGGAQENTLLTCRGLVQRGHDVTLIAGTQTGPEGSLHEAALATGARLVLHPHLRREIAPISDLLEVGILAERLRADRPQIVHTHSSKAGIIGRLAARLAGVPVVVHTNHGLPFHESQPAVVRATWRSMEQAASRITDRILCVGRDMVTQSIAAHLGPPRLFSVIRSGIDVDLFFDGEEAGRALRREFGIPESVPVVGTVGRLSAQKGPEHFLEAIARLSARLPEARFLWVGDGPLRPAMERAAAEKGVRVSFTGLVAPDRVPACLAAMDVVLITSLWEGLPRVAVQAALAARPVVAFDAPGVREVVLPGVSGDVVARGDAAELAAGAERILRLPDRGRMLGLEGRRRFADEFRWEKMVDDIDQVYAALVSRPKRGAIMGAAWP